jgi:hypothetical protein
VDFRVACGEGRGMLIVAHKLDRSELRLQNRYLSPIFEVIVGCELFRSIDWSHGGVHLNGLCEGVVVGSAVDGWIGLPEMRQAFGFTGEVLRLDCTTGNTVLRFDEVEAGAVEFLDRSLLHRLH